MKRVMKLILPYMILALLICGCTQGSGAKEKGSGIKVVTTIFPEYDWVREIVGKDAENIDLAMLLDNGVDLHSYQPTVDDILKISKCDLFIYVGGESDEWVEDALQEAVNKDMIVINLLETLGEGVKEEETVEGMEHEDEHDHDDEHEEGHDHDDHDHENEEGHEHHHTGEIEYDEHVWLSLKNASIICDAITEALTKLDPDKKDVFKTNLDAYKAKLEGLDGKYREAVDAAPIKTILFGDRFPFRYLTDDYGLSYYAAFAGCSAETEASFETVIFLSGKVDELGLPAVFTIEGSDHKLAEMIRENTTAKDQKILTLDSIQSVTSKDVEAGKSYISIMESNLDVLKEALF